MVNIQWNRPDLVSGSIEYPDCRSPIRSPSGDHFHFSLSLSLSRIDSGKSKRLPSCGTTRIDNHSAFEIRSENFSVEELRVYCMCGLRSLKRLRGGGGGWLWLLGTTRRDERRGKCNPLHFQDRRLSAEINCRDNGVLRGPFPPSGQEANVEAAVSDSPRHFLCDLRFTPGSRY